MFQFLEYYSNREDQDHIDAHINEAGTYWELNGSCLPIRRSA